MPYIEIIGVPDSVTSGELAHLAKKIKEAVAGVNTFDGLLAGAVVCCPIDRMIGVNQGVLAAKISGVFIRSDRGQVELRSLVSAVSGCLQRFALLHLPTYETAEVCIDSQVKPEDCEICELAAIRCLSCEGRGDDGDVEICESCGGSGRKPTVGS